MVRRTFIALWQWLQRTEWPWLVAGFIGVACLWGFIEMLDEVREGETQQLDEWVLVSLRRADDPAVPVGPAWLRETAIDCTALGGVAVLALLVAVVAGYMLLEKYYALMWLTIVATGGGGLLNWLLKELVGRQRPSVVPHLREITTPSFPSGHAMLSAVVYLTLGILLTRVASDHRTKLYFLGVAALLTVLVGCSRVYLGVHYPTDVLAGWMVGITWALACWGVMQYLVSRRKV